MERVHERAPRALRARLSPLRKANQLRANLRGSPINLSTGVVHLRRVGSQAPKEFGLVQHLGLREAKVWEHAEHTSFETDRVRSRTRELSSVSRTYGQ